MRQLGLIPCEEGLARLDDRQTETAHARCAIVAHVLPLHELGGMPIKKAVAFVVAEAAAGRLPEDVARLIPLANARNNGERGLSEPTLYRWVRAYADTILNTSTAACRKIQKRDGILRR
jgi:bacteriophage transposase